MSSDTDRTDPPTEIPSNYELSKRTARMEQQIDYIANSVDRIENDLSENQQEIMGKVDEMEDKVDTIWHAYVLARFLFPVLVGSGGIAGYYVLL